ncbi:SIR2 family protein [Kineococcus radiotolerans]|uniref:SIR2 family protein n=1 Tax=Kineococcus radiotolerans TaxID=131568 RepID=UPI00003A3C3D|nr:SIR2 family protein [Kineococcus radiotolerans]
MDAHVSLALALQSGPGTVAALLGAGASASAGLPTAWEVRQELIRRAALAAGEAVPTDPEAWWSDRGGSAGYDGLLAELAPTPAGRRDLLRGFFEPTEDGRERGEKRPGAVHHALAQLVVTGAVRVVLTLNFDRLIETALREAGIEPVVIDSPAAVEGMEPLQHQRAVVVHLHGDYLSPATLNTPEELNTYPAALNALIDEVFDRYGLLVIGWSATWDNALRARLQAARSPRYGTWWIDQFPLSGHAQDLASARRAAVAIADAGVELARVVDALQALAEQRLQDPVGPPAAVAFAKRALAGANVAIGLHDTLSRETDRVANLDAVRSNEFNVGGNQLAAVYARRRDQILAGTATLSALVATSAYWGNERTDAWWLPTITRSVPREIVGGLTPLIGLRLGVATLLTHAAGIAATAVRRDELVAHLAAGNRLTWNDQILEAAAVLTPAVLWAEDGADAELRLREYLRPLLQNHLALGAAGYEHAWEDWAAVCYLTRRQAGTTVAAPLMVIDGNEPYAPALKRLKGRIKDLPENTGLFAHGNLGGRIGLAWPLLERYESQVAEWAKELDRNHITPFGAGIGGGVIPTGPRYPGRPDLAWR